MVPTSDSEAGGLSYIEQFTAITDTNSPADCCMTPNRPYLRGVNHNEKRVVFFRPRCKLWSCPYCAEVNKKLWTARAFHGAAILSDSGSGRQSNLITFLTLTSHRNLGPQQSIEIFSSAWDVLLKRARRSVPQGQYLLVPERHKDGRLHAHAVTTFNLGKRWWKDNAAETGLGYMAEEEIARTAGGAAFYVSKYLAKSLGVQDWPAYWRRVRTSRQWPKLPEPEQPDGWRFNSVERGVALQDVVRKMDKRGYEIVFLNHHEAWAYIGEERK